MLNKVKINGAISLHIDFIGGYSLVFPQSLKPFIQQTFNDTLNLRWTEYKEFSSELTTGCFLVAFYCFVLFYFCDEYITYIQYPCMVNLLNITFFSNPSGLLLLMLQINCR